MGKFQPQKLYDDVRPPVVAPALNTSPRATAISVAPTRAASSGSAVTAPTGVRRLVKKDVTAVQYKVDKMNFQPNFHIPITNIGILMTNIQVPVSIPASRFRMMAMPVTPPEPGNSDPGTG